MGPNFATPFFTIEPEPLVLDVVVTDLKVRKKPPDRKRSGGKSGRIGYSTAAVMIISTFSSGRAIFDSPQARTGAYPSGIHLSQTEFISS